MSDTVKVFGRTYSNVTSMKVSDGNSNTLTYVRPQGDKAITNNGNNIDVASYSTVSVAVTEVKYKATVLTTGGSAYSAVSYNNTTYYTENDSFSFTPGDELSMFARGTAQPFVGRIYVNGVQVAQQAGGVSYTYTLPSSDIQILLGLPTQGQAVTSVRETSQKSYNVDFIDYDGTLLYSYTTDQFLTLISMPSVPPHEGLVFQGWNWTLAEAKSYVGQYSDLVVGATYKTDDGATHLFVDMNECWHRTHNMYLVFITTEAGGATIDWGDGNTEQSTGAANSYKVYSHTYSSVGKYEIIITVNLGTIKLGYDGANNGLIYNAIDSNTLPSKFSADALYEAWIGNNAVILTQAFTLCHNLRKIMIGESVTVGAANNNNPLFGEVKELPGLVMPRSFNFNRTALFSHTYPANSVFNIRFISFPATMTEFGSKLDMFSLEKITLPPITNNPLGMSNTTRSLRALVVPGTYTTISDSTFTSYTRTNTQIKKIFIPATVTSIGARAFQDLLGVEEVHVYATTPPTITTTTFSGMQTSWNKFYVPQGTLSAYQTATNWATYASMMEEEST